MIDSPQSVSIGGITFFPNKKESGDVSPLSKDDETRKPFSLEDPKNQTKKGKESEGKTQELDESEKQQVRELEKRDREVKNHENAHLSAAGSLALGGPQYIYQIGPDGKSYAVGGHVQIDTSPGRTPQETISKARQIRAAALAPSDPSGQDIKVASAANSMEQEAAKELSSKKDGEPNQSPFSLRAIGAYSNPSSYSRQLSYKV